MPANNTKAKDLNKLFPGRIQSLMGPSGWSVPSLRVCLDNDRFSVWSRGRSWDSNAYLKFLDKASQFKPLWGVVPDVVGDAMKTFEWYQIWKEELNSRSIPKALAVQDGMTPESVKEYCKEDSPEVIFVGGTTEWKRSTTWSWCRNFSRVHVGRINTKKWLWHCYRCGVESCDGTGWFRGNKGQLQGLKDFLRKTSRPLKIEEIELEYSKCFS